MPGILKRSTLFTVIASTIVLAVDALLSLFFQPPPLPAQRTQFLVSHGTFHAAVLVLSALGVALAFGIIRNRVPSVASVAAVAITYGIATVIAGPGFLVLAGILGAGAWLVLGSFAFGLGAGLFSKPWRRPVL